MKILFSIVLLLLLLPACREKEELPGTGAINLRFDNIVGSISTKILTVQGSEDYPYTNEFGQKYNLVKVEYIISQIVLEGPNGEYYADELVASAEDPKGYYLIDESNLSSLQVKIENLPSGTYNKVSFTMGVEQEGVEQGAGIFIDRMFWTWNSGYIILKVEGQSPDSRGEALGDNIDETNPYGFAFHIGGWDAINNNQHYSFTFDEVIISPKYLPEVHLVMDVKRVFEGQNPTNFSLRNSVHTPKEGFGIAQNLVDVFQINHVHQ